MKKTGWLQISAGQGPKECGWVVTQVCKKITKQAEALQCDLSIVEALSFSPTIGIEDDSLPESARSILVRIEGLRVNELTDQWYGTVLWHGESPYRPKHKRKNWYVSIVQVSEPNLDKTSIEQLKREVTVETFRSKGPGGQHVNKTNSAVRITHEPTGIAVRVETERSQHRNRKIALERLIMLLQQRDNLSLDSMEHQRWLNHYAVERGNARRIFTGKTFREVPLGRKIGKNYAR